MQCCAGPVTDRFGMTRPAVFSLLISVVGMLIFTLSRSLWAAQWARAFMGGGAAFATVILFALQFSVVSSFLSWLYWWTINSGCHGWRFFIHDAVNLGDSLCRS